jgi:hypothetical protein
MARATSNAEAVARGLLAIADAIDLTDGIGEDCLDLIAEGIADRTIADQAMPDGGPLPDLTAPYLKRKVAQGFPALTLVRTGAMLAMVNLKGERTIAPDSAAMTYGTTEAERAKAGYAHDGAPGRPERPFYGLDDAIAAAVHARLAEHLGRVLGD